MNFLSAIQDSGFQVIDLVIVLLYISLLVFLGLFLGRNKGGKEKSANDYLAVLPTTITSSQATPSPGGR